MSAGDGYIILTGLKAMQPQRIHWWLDQRSHWARGIPMQTVQTMLAHSFCVGAFHEGLQIGFARFITDYAVFAYLADVYVEEEHRGKGLSKQMMEVLMSQPWISGMRRFMLATKDAHGLYAQYGFRPLHYPERMMEIFHRDLYTQTKQS